MILKFTATGLVIYERNYLDVYIYENWNSKEIHNYQVGNTFEPTEISMPEGSTSPPSLLTEAGKKRRTLKIMSILKYD